MTNRLTHIDFVECYRAIFQDWLGFHPEDHSETVRDDKRIALESSCRGLPFFTIDLPAIGKILDHALDTGLLVPSGLPHTRPYKRGSVIPRLFRGFWMRLFYDDGRLKEDIDPNDVAFFRTILYLGKKLKMDCAPRYVNDTVKEYYDVEKILPKSSDLWTDGFDGVSRDRIGHLLDLCDRRDLLQPSDHAMVRPSGDSSLFLSVQLVLDRLAAELGFIEDAEIKPKHGPGAVSETVKDGYKYNFPSWNPRLEAVLPFSSYGVHSPEAFLENSIPTLYPPIEESASKLIAVPKTQKGPRLIASEPVGNQWMQQGVAEALRSRVAVTTLGNSIDFFNQEPSRNAALEASRDGSMATIDLSSASDRLSTWLVQRVFRSNLRLLTLLQCTRTRYLRNPDFDVGPKLIELRKYASMGSALTFPVQSVVFASLAIGYGVAVTGRSIRDISGSVRVFGDDIIIPKEWVDGFSSMLEKLYLKVNRSKTFFRGFFRESCGMDAWRGHDVTPGYLRQPSSALHTREALGYLDVINNFFLKGYWRLSKYLERTARWSSKLYTVNCRSRAFGLATFCNGLSPALLGRVRWDDKLHYDVVTGYRLVSGKPGIVQVESWNGLAAFFYDVLRRPENADILVDDDGDFVPLSSVVESTSRMPALIRRTRVPIHQLV